MMNIFEQQRMIYLEQQNKALKAALLAHCKASGQSMKPLKANNDVNELFDKLKEMLVKDNDNG